MSLAGERVVVVGGTSGMGAATVRVARRLGAEVVSAGRRPAAERGPRRVNAIRPGYTDSDFWTFLSDEEREELRRRVAEGTPVRRLGTPEDVAQAAVFLMTCPQVTGTVLEVNGGETLVNSVD